MCLELVWVDLERWGWWAGANGTLVWVDLVVCGALVWVDAVGGGGVVAR